MCRIYTLDIYKISRFLDTLEEFIPVLTGFKYARNISYSNFAGFFLLLYGIFAEFYETYTVAQDFLIDIKYLQSIFTGEIY